MTILVTLKALNAERWHQMHIRANRLAQLDARAKVLCAPDAKSRYTAISNAVWNTPDCWPFIGVVHEREASGPPHWDRQLGQGDPLSHVSTHDPKGRGPWLSSSADYPGNDAFHRAAIDALEHCAPFAGRWRDWSIGGVLTLLEEYNGFGYAERGVPSAYVWSGSDQYVSGKFVADHVYRRGVVDVQEGCAPLLSRMIAFDSSAAKVFAS